MVASGRCLQLAWPFKRNCQRKSKQSSTWTRRGWISRLLRSRTDLSDIRSHSQVKNVQSMFRYSSHSTMLGKADYCHWVPWCNLMNFLYALIICITNPRARSSRESQILPISIEVFYETNPNGNTKNVDNIFTPLSPSKSSKCDKVFVGWKIFHLCCSSLTVVFNKDNCHIFSNRSSCFDWPDLDWCQEGCLSWSGSREESFPNFDCRLWTWRPCLLATAIQRTYGRSERNYLARCSPQLRERKSDYF